MERMFSATLGEENKAFIRGILLATAVKRGWEKSGQSRIIFFKKFRGWNKSIK